MGSTHRCPWTSTERRSLYFPLPPPILLALRSNLFLSRNRSLDIESTSFRATFFTFVHPFRTFDVTHATLYFLSPFPVIYLSRDEVDQSVRFFLYDLTGKYFSNVSRESGLFHVTFSQLFEWKKVRKSVSIWSLFVFSLFDFLEFSFRGFRREIFALNIRKSSSSLPREQSYFNVTWIGISLIDKWDLPGIRDDNSVFLFFPLLFYFLSLAKSFPPLKNKKNLDSIF